MFGSFKVFMTTTPTHAANLSDATSEGLDFIRTIVQQDLLSGKHGQVVTRFPPEPNGYLHMGHAKSICLNFGLAEEYNGLCTLRMDDTNPLAENQEYISNIQRDVQWLGFNWQGNVRYASAYFDQLHTWALQLIEQGDAYVDLQTPEAIKLNRGNFNEPGINSPHRNASVAENLTLFANMRLGHYSEGQAVLRAKIDMAHPNMNMRDPVLYRILHTSHHQTGEAWCIYPMYDYAHPLSDAIEGITHSLCTLEFADHRALYDWLIDTVNPSCKPRQIEFSRLNVEYTLTSKRKLKKLVDDRIVDGWDDPRMPTIAGMRRRGFTPEGIRDFCKRVGVSKKDSTVDVGLLEFCVRASLENTAARAMAVLRPLKLTLSNLPATVEREHARHPNVDMGMRKLTLSNTLYIDQQDFALSPPEGFKRLTPGSEVRLRHGFIVRCDDYVLDAAGQVCEVICSIDPNTLGKAPEGRKVKGVIHWVDASTGVPAEFRLFERLFNSTDPEEGSDFMASINHDSKQVLHGFIEPSLALTQPGDRLQFEREGYFVQDNTDSKAGSLVFNRILDLKDSFKPT